MSLRGMWWPVILLVVAWGATLAQAQETPAEPGQDVSPQDAAAETQDDGADGEQQAPAEEEAPEEGAPEQEEAPEEGVPEEEPPIRILRQGSAPPPEGAPPPDPRVAPAGDPRGVTNLPDERTGRMVQYWEPEMFDSGNIAWMLTSSALVLMMTGPGLALFYCGLVRKKNVLSVMMQCVFLMGLMSVVWALWGYSFAFAPTLGSQPEEAEAEAAAEEEAAEQGEADTGPTYSFLGGTDYLVLRNLGSEIVGSAPGDDGESAQAVIAYAVQEPYAENSDQVPHLVFMVFQMMFFVITPALIVGGFAERMKFGAMVLFMVLWGTFVYVPLAHWVWGGGWLGEIGALDYAGGTVVHISSGVSALVCALVIGRRLGYGQEPMPPHNLTYTAIGACLLWVGWFGFNAGSAIAADGSAVNAFVATHLATAAGLLGWSMAEWLARGKATILGACSGAVAGLVTITPACGYVTPASGIVIGFLGGLACYCACTWLKNRLRYDDALDVFGVHGVGGTTGALLTGVFATEAVSPGSNGLLYGNAAQLGIQAIGVLAAVVLAVVGTLVILKIVDLLVGIRVPQQQEIQGLDVTQHGEEGYIFL